MLENGHHLANVILAGIGMVTSKTRGGQEVKPWERGVSKFVWAVLLMLVGALSTQFMTLHDAAIKSGDDIAAIEKSVAAFVQTQAGRDARQDKDRDDLKKEVHDDVRGIKNTTDKILLKLNQR